MTVTKPAVNLNGTSRGELMNQTGACVDALHAALQALYAATPHGRDYQTRNAPAYSQARSEHTARIKAVDRAYEEMLVIHLSLVEGQEAARG